MEIVLDKINYNILHCFTNYGLNGEDIGNNEKYISQDILKIFYDNKKWSCITNNDKYDNILKFNDMYEIINKEYYYTYIIKNNKLRFISKCKKNNIIQNFNKEIHNIYINNDKYEFYMKIFNVNKEIKECKYNLKCINPNCKYIHHNDYDINKAYNEYLIYEKKKKSKFKTIKCNNDDDQCIKHKHNRCIFLHKNDPTDIICA